ncbi:MAG TPA: helix-turn-helix transcriptional regulator [Terrimicrobiaceae bacterium]
MSRVAVKRELLRWARERSGLEAADLAERFPKYEAWESGDEQPPFRQLEEIARKTLTPFGYFFMLRGQRPCWGSAELPRPQVC